jgi:CheY-like chemotaxis protein
MIGIREQSRTGTPKRQLVVEDDPRVREYSAEILRDLGYSVIEAEDGPAALRQSNATKPLICCSPTSACRG